MLAGLHATPGRLDSVDPHALVGEERVEEADGVRAAADAGDQRIGQPALGLQYLPARLDADHRLEVAHHGRIGVRTDDRPDDVVGVFDVGDPVAQRLVGGVLERR